MVSKDVVRNIFKVAAWLAAGYAVYRITKGDSVKEATMKVADVVDESSSKLKSSVKSLKEKVNSAKKRKPSKHTNLVKGSQEAKDRMAAVRAKQKGNTGRKKGVKNKPKK